MGYAILRQIGRAILLGGENDHVKGFNADVEMELNVEELVGDRRIGDLPLGVNKISAEDARALMEKHVKR